MLENAIRETRQYGSERFINSESIHILFGVDQNYVMPMGLTMISILRHNKNVVFHVLIDDYPSFEDESRLRGTIEQCDAVCYLYLVDSSFFTDFPSTSRWSIATWFRLLIESFYGKVNRILYLDCDIFCRGSLKELFFLDLKGNTIAAVDDIVAPGCQTKQRELYADIGLLGDALYVCRYFNAGVLLIDVGKWHCSSVTENAFSLLRENPQRWAGRLDQDLLNFLLAGHVCWLDARWNTMIPRLQGIEKEAVLVHFIDPKPWRAWSIGTRPGYDEEYQEMLQSSPWNEVQPQSSTELRLTAKKCFLAGSYWDGICWQMRYLRKKLFP